MSQRTFRIRAVESSCCPPSLSRVHQFSIPPDFLDEGLSLLSNHPSVRWTCFRPGEAHLQESSLRAPGFFFSVTCLFQHSPSGPQQGAPRLAKMDRLVIFVFITTGLFTRFLFLPDFHLVLTPPTLQSLPLTHFSVECLEYVFFLLIK